MREYEILDVHAIEILDSRANPTLEVTVTLKDGITGSAAVPSGASTGQYEAHELRDGDKRHLGNGVEQAVTNVNTRIADKIIGMNVLDQVKIDRLLIQADGTENKSKYGANAILGVSLACAQAAANALGLPLYRYIGGTNAKTLPIPMMNILNGGKHADNTVDIQEFMIAPVGADTFLQAMEMACEIYHHLKQVLKSKGLSTGVGDEGGFAPDLATTSDVLDLIVEAIERAGYRADSDIKIALDAAASELYDENTELYYFPGESKMAGKDIYRNAEEMVQYYEDLVQRYPIFSIEDGLNENDMKGWKLLTYRLGEKLQLVGDDLFVTNTKRLADGIRDHIANAVLIKFNQIGTLTETLDAIEMAKNAGYKTIVSHRSGETEDTFIADLAVAVGSGQIKTGAPCRSDRTAKYNRLLKIEKELGKVSEYRFK
ncbi:MAG: phosphopyruvate hydratase [Lachnospiraceae bacterium]|nr:phosphopyruvate hydratase [Lachnospiraceae bacterium]MDE6626089.1 phosphopyruvate hydratase [Lachnospiraceae bacterium]